MGEERERDYKTEIETIEISAKKNCPIVKYTVRFIIVAENQQEYAPIWVGVNQRSQQFLELRINLYEQWTKEDTELIHSFT